MILDAFLVFDGSFSATGAFTGVALTTTAVSTNVIDLQSAAMVSGAGLTPPVQQGRDIGIAPEWTPIHVKSFVVVTLAGGTSVNVQYQGAPDNGAGAPGTYYTIYESGVILTANLTAGQDMIDGDCNSVPAGYAMPRFLRVNYVIAGTYTSGTVFSALTLVTDNQPIGPTGLISGFYPGFKVAN